MTKPIAGFLVLAGLLAASEAEAQYIVGARGGFPAPYSAGYPGAYAPGMVAGSSAPLATPPYPYSYYVNLPSPARGYVGYGQDEFPFNGRAYGHPYDPWTWAYLSRGYQASLVRYYDPPVK